MYLRFGIPKSFPLTKYATNFFPMNFKNWKIVTTKSPNFFMPTSYTFFWKHSNFWKCSRYKVEDFIPSKEKCYKKEVDFENTFLRGFFDNMTKMAANNVSLLNIQKYFLRLYYLSLEQWNLKIYHREREK